MGNKANYANLQMLKSKIISRRSKLQIHKTLIRPILTCGAETWTLTEAEQNALRTEGAIEGIWTSDG